MCPNCAKRLWQHATALRIFPTPGCAWPRLGACKRKPARHARSCVGPVSYAPSACSRGKSRGARHGTPASGVGGWITKARSTACVWPPSLALAPVTMTPNGMARAAQTRGSAVPHLPRSTGLGPVCSPLFCGLLGALHQHLIPVDPLPSVISLGQLVPGLPKGFLGQPHFEPPLDPLLGGQPGKQPAPSDTSHQDIQHGVPTSPILIRSTALAPQTTRSRLSSKSFPPSSGTFRAKSGSCLPLSSSTLLTS